MPPLPFAITWPHTPPAYYYRIKFAKGTTLRGVESVLTAPTTAGERSWLTPAVETGVHVYQVLPQTIIGGIQQSSRHQ